MDKLKNGQRKCSQVHVRYKYWLTICLEQLNTQYATCASVILNHDKYMGIDPQLYVSGTDSMRAKI